MSIELIGIAAAGVALSKPASTLIEKASAEDVNNFETLL